MFIDKVRINIKAGDGGHGAVSFRREKYVPRGGPDGGDGGMGGSVVVRVNERVSTLGEFRYKRLLRADQGEDGSGGQKRGSDGKDLVLSVPVGTIVWQERPGGGDKEVVAELLSEGQEVVLVRGGRRGRGNARFATATLQAPRFAQRGSLGEEGTFLLELKLLADVGIVGYPNAGKSTLLAALTQARPKIAAYPFTTLEPNLAMVETQKRAFLLADIPGIIEGAHQGVGLGEEFLRHIERTRLLIHVVDGSSEDPLRQWQQVNREMALYNPLLPEKPQIVALNKVDLLTSQDRQNEIRDIFRKSGQQPLFISALYRTGVQELLEHVLALLEKEAEVRGTEEGGFQLFRPRPVVEQVEVVRQGEVYDVRAPRAERIMALSDLKDEEAYTLLKRKLSRLGVVKALKGAGVEPGDMVRIGAVQFAWR